MKGHKWYFLVMILYSSDDPYRISLLAQSLLATSRFFLAENPHFFQFITQKMQGFLAIIFVLISYSYLNRSE